MASKKQLAELAKYFGLGDLAKKMIKHDKANTKAGKQAAPKRKKK